MNRTDILRMSKVREDIYYQSIKKYAMKKSSQGINMDLTWLQYDE